MVRCRVLSGQISPQGWHHVIKEGEVHVFDVRSGGFVPTPMPSMTAQCGSTMPGATCTRAARVRLCLRLNPAPHGAPAMALRAS